jgi:hypothetical protein
MSFSVSPEKREQMAEFGGRHYRGPGLRPTKGQGSWHCPNCGAENMGRIEDGCTACPAGRPQPVQEKPMTMPRHDPTTARPAPQLMPRAGQVNKTDLLNDIRQIVREELSQSLSSGFPLTGQQAFILRSLLDNIDMEAAAPEFSTTPAALSQLRDQLVAYELEHAAPDTYPEDGAPE